MVRQAETLNKLHSVCVKYFLFCKTAYNAICDTMDYYVTRIKKNKIFCSKLYDDIFLVLSTTDKNYNIIDKMSSCVYLCLPNLSLHNFQKWILAGSLFSFKYFSSTLSP